MKLRCISLIGFVYILSIIDEQDALAEHKWCCVWTVSLKSGIKIVSNQSSEILQFSSPETSWLHSLCGWKCFYYWRIQIHNGTRSIMWTFQENLFSSRSTSTSISYIRLCRQDTGKIQFPCHLTPYISPHHFAFRPVRNIIRFTSQSRSLLLNL